MTPQSSVGKPTAEDLLALSRQWHLSGLLNALRDLEESGSYSPELDRVLLCDLAEHKDPEVSSWATAARFAMLLKSGHVDAAVTCSGALLNAARHLHDLGRYCDARYLCDALERMLENIDHGYTWSDRLTRFVESAVVSPPDVAKYALALIRRSGFATPACQQTMMERSMDSRLPDWHRAELIKTLEALERAKIDHISLVNAE